MNHAATISWPRAWVEERRDLYRDGLLHDVLPFWMEHAIDRTCGGFHFCLDRRGRPINHYKSVSLNARFVWLLSTLYYEFKNEPRWLEWSRHGMDFLDRFAIGADGRAHSLLNRRGKAVRTDRHHFPDRFLAMAKAAYARASGETRQGEEALEIYRRVTAQLGHPHRAPRMAGTWSDNVGWITRYLAVPGLVSPEGSPLLYTARRLWGQRARPGGFRTRVREQVVPGRIMIQPLVTLLVGQQLRHAGLASDVEHECMSRAVEDIRDFLDGEHDVFREVLPERPEEEAELGAGHGFEAAWVLLHEAHLQNGNPDLLRLALRILDTSLRWGWDDEHGGVYLARTLQGGKRTVHISQEKLWWPHNEAIVATLLAYLVTGQERYRAWYEKIHAWSYAHFPDAEGKEWFGFLKRDGRVAYTTKGSLAKGPFHLPRMQWYSWRLLENWLERGESTWEGRP